MLSTLRKLLGSRLEPEVEEGPLYPAVRDALIEVQAYARSHGGTIELISVTESGEVSVRFQGACKGCPVADLTFRHGIELQLKTLVPGVTRVIRV
ncbi:MAG: NifU family protein [Fimbriimonas sp.]